MAVCLVASYACPVAVYVLLPTDIAARLVALSACPVASYALLLVFAILLPTVVDVA